MGLFKVTSRIEAAFFDTTNDEEEILLSVAGLKHDI